MRSLVYRFDDLFSFGRALGASDQELPLPEGEVVADGEWVLAIFEVGERRRATAAAARGMDSGDGSVWLSFERRDWERLQAFSEAKSEKLRAAKPVAPPYEPIPINEPETEPDHPKDMGHPRDTGHPKGFGGSSIPAPRDSAPSLSPSTRPSWGIGVPVSSSQMPAAQQSSQSGSPRPPMRSTSHSSQSGIPITSPSGRFTSAPSARVLLVDDDADIRDVVGAMLEAVGLIVEPVTSAEDALDRVRETHFDLLVLDWNLPGMTGLDLCRQVRREPQFSGMPVLFLTAHSSSKDIVEAFASGADDYVSKPFRAPELGARIFGLLRRSRVGQTVP